mmetsp:Transcript_9669/g.23945  ORF Transcript_9669/g.23945 Transcript_9669/m.23945 type:complete len:227 (+) Transcript_9669:367-1047(+)
MAALASCTQCFWPVTTKTGSWPFFGLMMAVLVCMAIWLMTMPCTPTIMPTVSGGTVMLIVSGANHDSICQFMRPLAWYTLESIHAHAASTQIGAPVISKSGFPPFTGHTICVLVCLLMSFMTACCDPITYPTKLSGTVHFSVFDSVAALPPPFVSRSDASSSRTRMSAIAAFTHGPAPEIVNAGSSPRLGHTMWVKVCCAISLITCPFCPTMKPAHSGLTFTRSVT